MKNETKWIIGGVVVAGFAYYMWTKSKTTTPAVPAAQTAPQVPSGQPVPTPGMPNLLPTAGTPSPLPTGVPVLPAGVTLPAGFSVPTTVPQATTPVTLTTSFQAQDLNTGMIANFQPGQKVIVYGQPVAGYTTFVDTAVQPNMYITQSAVAGYIG